MRVGSERSHAIGERVSTLYQAGIDQRLGNRFGPFAFQNRDLDLGSLGKELDMRAAAQLGVDEEDDERNRGNQDDDADDSRHRAALGRDGAHIVGAKRLVAACMRSACAMVGFLGVCNLTGHKVPSTCSMERHRPLPCSVLQKLSSLQQYRTLQAGYRAMTAGKD